MKEFVAGSAEQFTELDRLLDDRKCHVYHDCVLPACCTPRQARLGFEKTDAGDYIIYIDRGIVADTANIMFRNFLARGETRFLTLDDMVSFLHELAPLFADTAPPTTESTPAAPDTPPAAGTPSLFPPVLTEPVPPVSGNNCESHNSRSPEEIFNRQEVHKLLREENTQRQQIWPEEIAEALKKEVFGQDEVIDDIAGLIASCRLSSKDRLLPIALLGPTATGKSETARSLAEVLTRLCGTEYGYIELAGNEFLAEHSVHKLFGAPPGYVGHGSRTALDAVRKNPYHVIVFNEIEKAHETLLVGLMEAIDTGLLGMADNTPAIDLNHCIMLFTSNLPIDMEAYRAANPYQQNEICRDAFSKHCGRPEISGKIENFFAFSDLSDDAIMSIVRKFVETELNNYDLHLAGIENCLMADYVKFYRQHGIYGAREIRYIVRRSIRSHLLKNRTLAALKHKTVTLRGTIENMVFDIHEQ
ncbi:MAG: ATP-dependent Clp protease ATP-binding subunit [Clostridia bacterium]|nr:ATP-dependent Clp protease ATP-binding subunit [Clostridia bacterium]